MKKTIKKPPSETQYRKAEIETAFSYSPSIYPCSECGWPVGKGYICGYCQSTNPSKNYNYSDL